MPQPLQLKSLFPGVKTGHKQDWPSRSRSRQFSLLRPAVEQVERFRDRGSSDLVVDPTADCPLAADDAVIVLGHGNELPELKKCYTEKREITYRGAKLQV